MADSDLDYDDEFNDATSVKSYGSGRSRSRSASPARRRRSSSSSSGGSRKASVSPPASRGSSMEREVQHESYPSLVATVGEQMELQTDDITSSLDPKMVLVMIKDKYKGVKSYADGYVPNARVNKGNGHHLAGCPCAICEELLSSLSLEERELARRIQDLRNWIPRGRTRPRCLALPGAVAVTGLQSGPFFFTGSSSALRDIERAFGEGVSLHPRLHSGRSVNSTSNLSSQWVGGKSAPSAAAASSSGALASVANMSAYTIPKVNEGVPFVKRGPRHWDRMAVVQDVPQTASFIASDEAMRSALELFSLPKAAVEKAVKSWAHEHCNMPAQQYGQIKLPPLPSNFDSVAKVDPAARARENALTAVGHALNYVLLSGVRLSEHITAMDESIPNLEIRVAALTSFKPPIYVSPTDKNTSASDGPGVYSDPAEGVKNSDHWLRSKGEDFLAGSSVLKDIFKRAEVDEDGSPVVGEDGLPAPVSREDYLEVCWRLATLREFSKMAKAHHDECALLVGKLHHASNLLIPELRQVQEIFSALFYPAMGYTRATIMFQRMEFFRNLLVTDFRQFLKDKAAASLNENGTEKPFMNFLIEDPVKMTEEFSEQVKAKAKQQDIFQKKKTNKDSKPSSSGATKRPGGGSQAAARPGYGKRALSPSRYLKKDKGRRDREDSPPPKRRRREDQDDRDRSPRRGRDQSRRTDKGAGRKDDKGKSKSNSSKGGGGAGGRGKKSGDKGKSFSSDYSFSTPTLFHPAGHLSPIASVILADFDTNVINFVSSKGFDFSVWDAVLALAPGGRTQKCIEAWRVITNSKWVLRTIESGVSWTWKVGPPAKSFRSPKGRIGNYEVLKEELDSLISKGALVTRENLPAEANSPTFVASYFAVPKKDKDKFRPIANLKPLNRSIANSKFKMESVKSVRRWLVKGAFMVSLDLTDAYLSLAVDVDRWRFLGLEFEGVDYFYSCLCFGLNAGPRIFTKCVKRIIQFFRSVFAIWITFYLDDLLAQNLDPQKLLAQSQMMILVLHLLGFKVNFKKSDLVPSQRVTYLGFIFDTISMTVSLPEEKVRKIESLTASFLGKEFITVKQLQVLMGTLESTRPAVRVAPLHYRKTQALLVLATRRKWSMKRALVISQGIKDELTWWVRELSNHSSSPMRDPPAQISIWSDAATSEGCGWGGHSSLGQTAQGVWSESERSLHINVLETMGAVKVVEALLPKDTVAAHYIDNTTAVAYVRNFGGTKSKGSCDWALKFWDIVLGRNSWVIPSHIQGKKNVMADFFSRHLVKHHEYGLLPEVFRLVSDTFFAPQFDLFASEACHVVERWASFCWTREAEMGDAFLLDRWPQRSYIFPPLPLLNEVVARLVLQEDLDFILIAPVTSNNPPMWYPIMKQLITESPLQLGRTREICRMDTGKKTDIPGNLAAFCRFRCSR